MRATMLCLLLTAFTAAGCGPQATPVTPAPLAAPEQTRISQSMLGKWKATHTKVGADGEKKEQPVDVWFTFNPDGTYHHVIHGPLGMGMDQTYRYQLDGRNVTTSSPHGTYRVDAVEGNEMTLFSYWASTWWYLKRD